MILPGFPRTLASTETPPEFVGASQARGAGVPSFAVPAPTGVEQGDVLVAFAVVVGVSGTVSAPAGWTTLDASGSANPSFALFYRVAGSAEPSSYAFSYTSGGGGARVAIVAFRNVSGVGDVGAATRGSSTATLTAPSVTLASRSLLLCAYGASGTPANSFPVSSSPAGMTLAIDSTGGGTSNPSVAIYWQFPGAAGSKTLTWASASNLVASSVGILQ